MLAGIVGSELMTTIGLTNRYQLFTPEHMMLDDDLYQRAANAFRDLELDEETLALDVIDAVGPGGHFLAQPHTRRHMKETVERSIGQEIGPDGVAPTRSPSRSRASAALDILENYAPEPLDADKAAELAAHLRRRRRGARARARSRAAVAGAVDVAQHEPAPDVEGRPDVQVRVGQLLQRDAVGDRHRQQRQGRCAPEAPCRPGRP